MAYKSECRGCEHKHAEDTVCRWQVHKVGSIKLKPTYSSLWGISGLHHHDAESGEIYLKPLNLYTNETFEYEQEMDCGCRYFVPSDNLEFLEWKYAQS